MASPLQKSYIILNIQHYNSLAYCLLSTSCFSDMLHCSTYGRRPSKPLISCLKYSPVTTFFKDSIIFEKCLYKSQKFSLKVTSRYTDSFNHKLFKNT